MLSTHAPVTDLKRAAHYALVGLLLVPLACVPTQSVVQPVRDSPVTDTRPIFAELALPAPGTRVPPFDMPRLNGTGRIASDSLHGSPAVVVLWSTGCVRSKEALGTVRELAEEYGPRGVNVIVLADDEDAGLARQVLAAAAINVPAGHAAGSLARHFDRSSTAPGSSQYRVEFVLPGFVILDADGMVRQRGAIILQQKRAQATLDSLVAAGVPPR